MKEKVPAQSRYACVSQGTEDRQLQLPHQCCDAMSELRSRCNGNVVPQDPREVSASEQLVQHNWNIALLISSGCYYCPGQFPPLSFLANSQD